MVRDCSSDNLTLLTNEVHAFAQDALKLKDILNHFAAFNFRPLPGCNIKTRTKWVNWMRGGEKALSDDNM